MTLSNISVYLIYSSLVACWSISSIQTSQALGDPVTCLFNGSRFLVVRSNIDLRYLTQKICQSKASTSWQDSDHSLKLNIAQNNIGLEKRKGNDRLPTVPFLRGHVNFYGVVDISIHFIHFQSWVPQGFSESLTNNITRLLNAPQEIWDVTHPKSFHVERRICAIFFF